jgi:hypothetical protein
MVCFLRRSSAQSGILVSPGPVTDAISNTIPIGRRWIIGEPVKMDQRTSAKIVGHTSLGFEGFGQQPQCN